MFQFKRYHFSENFLDHISWWEYFSDSIKTLIPSAVCQAQSEILYKASLPHHNTKKLLLPVFSFCKWGYPGLPKVNGWAGARLKHILFQCKKKSKKCILWLSVICQEKKKKFTALTRVIIPLTKWNRAILFGSILPFLHNFLIMP